MSENTYHFGDYTLRPTEETDLARAVEWTAADADHAGRTRPEFWLEQTINRHSFLLEDHKGPVFFFKVHRLSISAVELHCQFPPMDESDDGERTRMRVMAAMIRGFDWLEGTMKLSKIRHIFFDSTHTPLRAFAVRRLGFKPTTGTQRLEKHIGGN